MESRSSRLKRAMDLTLQPTATPSSLASERPCSSSRSFLSVFRSSTVLFLFGGHHWHAASLVDLSTKGDFSVIAATGIRVPPSRKRVCVYPSCCGVSRRRGLNEHFHILHRMCNERAVGIVATLTPISTLWSIHLVARSTSSGTHCFPKIVDARIALRSLMSGHEPKRAIYGGGLNGHGGCLESK